MYLLGGALCAGIYMINVNCRYKRIFSVSSQDIRWLDSKPRVTRGGKKHTRVQSSLRPRQSAVLVHYVHGLFVYGRGVARNKFGRLDLGILHWFLDIFMRN